VERLIGTLRRDCLDHVIIQNERHLRRIVGRYLDYYHDWRTHLSLSMDAPNSRTVHPPERGRVIEFAHIGGLHHDYERLAA
jgi:putative transposase